MNTIKILALAAFAALTIAPAAAQGMMKHKPMMHAQGKMDPMMGLSPMEKKVAMMHMKKMTPAEHKVMMKMHMMRSMGRSQKEAMKGLTKPEMDTAMAMMKKMTPMEKKVGMKMMDMAQKHASMKMMKPMKSAH